MSGFERVLLALAALAGLLGVAASAAAAHVSGAETLRTSAEFLLFHAPAVMALAALSGAGLTSRPVTRVAAGAMLLGLALFSGDLALRALAGHPLFPMAAPIGGMVLMAAWLVAGLAAFLPRRR
ncbi:MULTISPECIES: DUF423 domain-containing protein [Methylobacterium]|uniref:DUF423 domain-containing protein n=1 Tax=Methylobacterium jeotgali TaxID=381630 RepID=A0ABQ4T074_9HYPH|nr:MULTISPECIES: DUF423 domain-containing protein [Methylobacterium]PIU05017.1 MAG: DUF423 domain-containing protein [Methylobacterium sp. CG09_land_8_20_14_0_10_71_15]PIU11518.1 MAG: DUF423 domain-containing protein [Methylobacterium sp. CG08_land_8_20_14_0_20_71_15]GBU16586.1 membrane protein [Methylobacterium sp.]GJE07608.1 hypothetical protein AOPFMNJM_2937 [Methylobacterium jeotgali]